MSSLILKSWIFFFQSEKNKKAHASNYLFCSICVSSTPPFNLFWTNILLSRSTYKIVNYITLSRTNINSRRAAIPFATRLPCIRASKHNTVNGRFCSKYIKDHKWVDCGNVYVCGYGYGYTVDAFGIFDCIWSSPLTPINLCSPRAYIWIKTTPP